MRMEALFCLCLEDPEEKILFRQTTNIIYTHDKKTNVLC